MPPKTRSIGVPGGEKSKQALQGLVDQKLLVGIETRIASLLEEVNEFYEREGTLKEFPNRNRFSNLRSAADVSLEQLAEVTGVKAKTLGNVEILDRSFSIMLAQTYLAGLARISLSLQGARERLVTESIPWLSFPKEREFRARQRSPRDPYDAMVEYSGSALSELISWCYEPGELLIKSERAYSGTGKTRLGIELCRAMKMAVPNASWTAAGWDAADWTSGFLCPERLPTLSSHWTDHDFTKRSVLIVVDEDSPTSRTDVLGRLLAGVLDIRPKRLRIVILGRSDRWLSRLKMSTQASRTVTNRVFREVHSVSEQPSIIETRYRAAEFVRAWKTYTNYYEFCQELPHTKEFLHKATAEPQLGRIAILHLYALTAAMTYNKSQYEKSILDDAMERERGRWLEGLRDHSLDVVLLRVVEAVYWKFSCVGGVANMDTAVAIGNRVKPFKVLPYHIKEEIIEMLHNCYEGPRWFIEPLSPDRLNRYFIATRV